MSQIKTLNGVQYTLPQYNDTAWGANTGNVLTQYLAAIADVTLQLSGGSFTLTADVDFGANFGLKALFLKSETANPASAGVVRLAKTDSIKWRNNANGADIALAIDGSDNLTYAATKVLLSGAVVNADINASAAIAYSKLALTGSIVNADINASAAIAYSKLALSASIVNADIATAAAIALTKLASTTAYYWYAANASGVLTPLAVTASRAVATDANGLPVASAVTATELGYVSGVTSAIQTQLNATIANPLTSNLAAGAHKITGLAAGSAAGDSIRYEQVNGFRALQIVTASYSTETDSTSGSYADTGLTAAITPATSSSKILVLVSLNAACGDATRGDFNIVRGVTDLIDFNNACSCESGATAAPIAARQVFLMYFDSPASSSSTTYKVQLRRSAGTGTLRTQYNASNQGISTITLIEIG